MNSEKVKEIKARLQEEIHLVEYVDEAYADCVSVDLLKDILTLINELEKENAELKVDLKNSIDMQKQMLDGFKTATKEVEENLAREMPNLLKQFAEKVAKRLININGIKQILDETLKEFLNEKAKI